MRARGSLPLSGSSEADAVASSASSHWRSAKVASTGSSWSRPSADHSYLLPEMMAGLPVVFADRPPGRHPRRHRAQLDNVGGSRQATAHLLAGGHRRIGYLGDNPDIYTAQERYRGYLEAMSGAARARRGSLWVARGSMTIDKVRAYLERIPRPPRRFSALICGNNRISVLALHALASLDVDMAMIGFDDFELADLLRVTVVAQDPGELGLAGRRTAVPTDGRRLRASAPDRHPDPPPAARIRRMPPPPDRAVKMVVEIREPGGKGTGAARSDKPDPRRGHPTPP